MTTETEKVQKPGAYMGRRFTTDNTLSHLWLVDGREMWFKKSLVRWAQIGEQFTVTTNAEGSSVYTGGDVAPVQRDGKHEKWREWELADNAAKRAYDRHRVEKKLEARRSELDLALDPIREFMKHARTHADREHFIGKITGELWRMR